MAVARENQSRRISLIRPSNMRELGGIVTGDGLTVRRGLVFRAGGLHNLEPDDIHTVHRLGLRTLVDLRTHKERERHGQATHSLAARRLHHPMIPDVWDIRPLDRGEALESYFVERYEEMLVHGEEAISVTLSLLGRADSYPLGYFCAAGKDRTGVMTAVLLRLLGVDDEAIVADYVLSGPEVNRLIEMMGDRERWTSERMGGGAPRLLTAPAGVMRTFLSRLPEAEALTAAFGLSADKLGAMRRLLLESPPGPR